MGSVMAQLDGAWAQKRAVKLPSTYFTSAEYARHVGVTPTRAWARLKALVEQGVVRQVTASGGWRGWEFLGRGEQGGSSVGQGDIQAEVRGSAGAEAVAHGDTKGTGRGRRKGTTSEQRNKSRGGVTGRGKGGT